jgi:transposase
MSEKARIGFEEFINCWESSETVDDVCGTLGMDKQNAYARAAKYRQDGIPLKKFAGGGGRSKISTEQKLEILAKARGVSMEEIVQEAKVLAEEQAKRKAEREAVDAT